MQMALGERADVGTDRGRVRTAIIIAPDVQRPLLDWREIWAYREVLYALIRREIQVRYAQTIAGAGWVILQPLLTAAVLTLLASRWADAPALGVPYTLFVVSGLIPWNYFNHVLTKSSICLISTGLVSKVYFPRLLLVLAAVAGGLLDVLIALPVLALLMAWFRIAPSWHVVLLPVSLLVVLMITFGMGAWISVLNLHFRDVSHALPFFLQLGLFLTPAAYPVTLIPMHWRWLYALNPMVGAVECWRWCLFGGPFSLAINEAAVSAGTAIFLLLTGLMYFRLEEPTLADVGE